jgi:thymidylate synthase
MRINERINMIEIITANDIPDAWFLCLHRIIEKGYRYKIDSGSYEGQDRIELDYVSIEIKYPATRPLLPKLNPSLGIPEPASDEYLESYVHYLLTDEVKEGEQYTYGQFIVPQLHKIIQKYKRGGHRTNQCTIMIGNEHSVDLIDPPCLRIIDTKIMDGYLHFYVYFRSWDCWGGFPVNLAGLEYVKEYLACELNVLPGKTFASSKGLHIYDYAENLVKNYIFR